MIDITAIFKAKMLETLDGSPIPDDELNFFINMTIGSDDWMHRGEPRLVNLEEARQLFEDDEFDFTDWVYIREWQMVYFNVTRHTTHCIFMGQLAYFFEQAKKGFRGKWWNNPIDWEEYQDKFVEDGYGFFRSSATGYKAGFKPHLLISDNISLTIAEKMAFNKLYNFERMT